MPCDVGRIWKTKEENSAVADKLLDILGQSSLWLCGASKEKFIAELKLHSEKYRLESLAHKLAQKPLLCVEAALDSHTPPKYHCRPFEVAVSAFDGNQLRTLQFETDHFASDCRVELADSVVSYMTELSCTPPVSSARFI